MIILGWRLGVPPFKETPMYLYKLGVNKICLKKVTYSIFLTTFFWGGLEKYPFLSIQYPDPSKLAILRTVRRLIHPSIANAQAGPLESHTIEI